MEAILVYVIIGLLAGAIGRFARPDTSSMAGMVGIGGSGGAAGGVIANLLFSDGVRLDWAGLAGSAVLAIVAVLVIRIANQAEPIETNRLT